MNCPSCTKSLSWKERIKFTNRYTKRLKKECPFCGTNLIFTKLPLRGVNLGVIVMVLGAIIEIATDTLFIHPYYIVLGGAVCILLSTLLMKLKIAK